MAAPLPNGPARRLTPHLDRDPTRLERIGGQSVITAHLLDRLEDASVDSPHLGGSRRTALRATSRAFPNPWRRDPHGVDHRVVWTEKARLESSLRSALALPLPGEARWTLTVPPRSELVFDTAVGRLTKLDDPVELTARVRPVGQDAQTVAWTHMAQPKALHRLKKWSPHRIDLSPWAGTTVELIISAKDPGNRPGHRFTALFAEPVVVTDASHEEGMRAARDATGLDVADNVLLIIVDAQRADTVGSVREEAKIPRVLPVMERIAASGVELSNAVSVGNQTRLSTLAMLSSQYPSYGHYHSVRWTYSSAEKAAFYGADPPLLPRLLRLLGYRTVAVANNLFLFDNLRLGLDAGFDSFVDHRHDTADTELITQSASAWIRAHHRERWFMMLNYNTPHVPYEPPRAMTRKLAGELEQLPAGYSKRYLGEVAWADEHIGRVMALLEELDLRRKTLVILTSDHGEIMDPRHECWSRNWKTHCLHQHGKTLFREELHVPLLFQLPERLPAGRVVDHPVSHIDLAPTVLGLLGAETTPDQLGRDLSDVLMGADPPEDPILLAESRLATSVTWRGH